MSTIEKFSISILNFVLLVFFVLTSFSIRGFSQTTDDRGIILSPAILELEGDRGSTYDFTVKIENDTDSERLEMSSIVNIFEAGNQEGIPSIQPIPDSSELSGWVSFKQIEFNLNPGEAFDSNFTVNIPDQTNPGSYFFAITYSANNNLSNELESSIVAIEKRVAALLFVTVKGTVERNVSIENFKSDKVIYDSLFDGIKIDYKISTSGNAYLKPAGNIFVGKNLENPKNILALNPNNNFILPNSIRSFNIVSQPRFTLPLLPARIEENSSVDFYRPLIGSQKVKASVLAPNNQGQLERKEAEIEMFFFPWKLTLIILVLFSFGVGSFFVIKPKLKKQKL